MQGQVLPGDLREGISLQIISRHLQTVVFRAHAQGGVEELSLPCLHIVVQSPGTSHAVHICTP